MKIVNSQVRLEASHDAGERQQTETTTEVSFGQRLRAADAALAAGAPAAPATPATPPAPLTLTGALPASLPASSLALPETLSLKQRLLLETLLAAMIEALTGRPCRCADARTLGLTGEEAGPTGVTGASSNSDAARPALEYRWRSVTTTRYAAFEHSRMSARCEVACADGRRISGVLETRMAWQVSTEQQVFGSGQLELKDPLVLNLNGGAVALTEQRFAFALAPDEAPLDLPALAQGSAFLVFDRNRNGQADDGSEWFGVSSGDGFADLARLDSDANGWIDSGDSDFAQLFLWRPALPGDVAQWQSLADAGVGALYLGQVATPFTLRSRSDAALGRVRAGGLYLSENGRIGSLQQVDLAV